jgi:N-methylhydantoinase A
VAELLESPRVVFPVNASVLSAFGTLVSPVRIDLARSRLTLVSAPHAAERDRVLDELRAEGRQVLTAAGVDPDSVAFRYGLDARYAGQGNELTLWLGEGDRFPVEADDLLARFEDEYRRVYGLAIPGLDVEIVTWRLSALSEVAHVPVADLPRASGPALAHHERTVRFRRGHDPVAVPVYRRTELLAGHRFRGPAIVEERETTSVIRPGWSAEVLADGTIVATREGS